MSPIQNNNPDKESIPAAEHGKMPKWLFFIWVAFLIWGTAYLIKYALPNLKEWSGKPLPTEHERAH